MSTIALSPTRTPDEVRREVAVLQSLAERFDGDSAITDRIQAQIRVLTTKMTDRDIAKRWLLADIDTFLDATQALRWLEHMDDEHPSASWQKVKMASFATLFF